MRGERLEWWHPGSSTLRLSHDGDGRKRLGVAVIRDFEIFFCLSRIKKRRGDFFVFGKDTIGLRTKGMFEIAKTDRVKSGAKENRE